MDHPLSSSSIPTTKSKGYRRRSRPTRISGGTNDGKDSSVSKHQQRASTRQASPTNEPVVIPFPVPSILSTKWLMKMSPIILAQHLLYARGMWPMSVPQLLLLQQQQLQDKSNQESEISEYYSNHNRFGSDSRKIENNKRQRLNHASRINPSLRRKQQRATDQINRLSEEWAYYVDGIPNAIDQKEQQCDRLPRFLLILLGSSHTRSRELYLLDFQSLIDGDENDAADPSANFTQEQEQKYKTMLARKLVSVLMNHRSKEGASVTNSLPAPTSPSFRLWFTAGFENHHPRDDFAEVIKPLESDDGTTTRDTSSTATSDLSTASWIPRVKFPYSNPKPHSRPSSKSQSLITIRFVRSSKQPQGNQQQHSSQQEGNRTNREDNSKDASSIELNPMSEKLSWMSLPSHVKGFRL